MSDETFKLFWQHTQEQSVDSTDFATLLSQSGAGSLQELDTQVVQKKRQQLFLPALPDRFFCTLVRLPRKSLAVYMVLLFRSRLEQCATVTLSTSTLRHFGITRKEKYTALRHLEAADVITVDRRVRKNPSVTLLGEISRYRVSHGASR